MEQLIGIDNSTLIRWTLLKADGRPLPVMGYTLRIWISAPRGRSEILNFSVTGADSNIVCFEINNPKLRFLGAASFQMSILRDGKQIAGVEARNALTLSRRSPRGCDCNQTVDIHSYVTLIHPEDALTGVNINFPTFEIDENMHLIMKANDDAFINNFELDEEDGHLYFTND